MKNMVERTDYGRPVMKSPSLHSQNSLSVVESTDYGRPVMKSPSLHSQNSLSVVERKQDMRDKRRKAKPRDKAAKNVDKGGFTYDVRFLGR